ncbi:hypothetical protein NI18_08315 [Sphingomonas sp. Ant20]|nr:hypothetical protein NI18_08315 [Sphingomonas sp. Ant20]
MIACEPLLLVRRVSTLFELADVFIRLGDIPPKRREKVDAAFIKGDRVASSLNQFTQVHVMIVVRFVLASIHDRRHGFPA